MANQNENDNRGSEKVSQRIDLAAIVQIAGTTIDREYIKNSMRAIPSETIYFRNIASNIDVKVSLNEVGGVTFEPNSFSLARLTEQPVRVNFDNVQINNFNDGVTTITCKVSLASDTVLMQPAIPAPPTQLPPAPDPIEVQPATPPLSPQPAPDLPSPSYVAPIVSVAPVPKSQEVVRREDRPSSKYNIGYLIYEVSNWAMITERVWDDQRPTEVVSIQYYTGEPRLIADETPLAAGGPTDVYVPPDTLFKVPSYPTLPAPVVELMPAPIVYTPQPSPIPPTSQISRGGSDGIIPISRDPSRPPISPDLGPDELT